MAERKLRHWRLFLGALATLAELAQLAWQHLHGGVVSHHLLDRADLPAVSNGWGALLVPALVWFLTGRIQRRRARCPGATAATFARKATMGFVVALLFGICIAVSFTHGAESITSDLFQAMVVLAILLPGYRAECVLGFVLGMMFTFGAVLPTVVAAVVAALSALVHLGVWPLLVRLRKRVGQGALS